MKSADRKWICLGSGGEGTNVGCLLSGSPDGINPGDQVLAQSEKTVTQGFHRVSRLNHMVQLSELIGISVTHAEAVSILVLYRRRRTGKSRGPLAGRGAMSRIMSNGTALGMEEGAGKSGEMIVGVLCRCCVGDTELSGKKGLAFWLALAPLQAL